MKVTPINSSTPIQDVLDDRHQREAQLINKVKDVLEMYKDNQVDKYYNPSLLANYDKRYLSFAIVILCIALIAVVIPLTIRFV